MKKANLRIGDLDLKSPFLLAPLAGITDQAMRSLCYNAGASLTYTEMVSAKGLWYGDRKTADLLNIAEEEGPVAYQLFGSEPVVLAHAVYELSEVADRKAAADRIPGPPPKPWSGYRNDRRPVLFDLNAGCPVPKIVKNGEGSALLRDPDLLYKCVSAMCDASREAAEETGVLRPVTVKIRRGFRRDEDLSVECAKAIEAAGAAAVTVHGRSREQYYDGRADWDCIARVREAVDIPVIGNGDVMCGADAIRMMEQTGCDGVMIARGALGNPWIFTEACRLYEDPAGSSAAGSHSEPGIGSFSEGVEGDTEAFTVPSAAERIDMLIRHIDLVCRYKGEHAAVREMRKHVGWYIKGMRGATEIRRRVNAIDDAEEMKRLIRSIL